MQLHGRGRGCAQHVLQRRQASVVLGGQLGLLLLEDGQSEHITATHRREQSGAEPHRAQAQRQTAKSEKWVLTWGVEGNTPKPMAACLWRRGCGGPSQTSCNTSAPRPHATPVPPEPGCSFQTTSIHPLKILFFTQGPSRDLLNQIKEAKMQSYLVSTN